MNETDLKLLKKYFPEISPEQEQQFDTLCRLYPEWNEKINVISRKDIGNLFSNHILHSLAIAKFLGPLVPGTKFYDLGTGGGFPGIPLAIMYPKCRFHLIDRVAKKLKVAADVAEKAAIKNISFQHGDSGECHEKFNYIVSRAVMSLNELVRLTTKNVGVKSIDGNRYANGIICLKGGDISLECKGIPFNVLEFPLNEFFHETFFDTKKLIYVPVIKNQNNKKHAKN